MIAEPAGREVPMAAGLLASEERVAGLTGLAAGLPDWVLTEPQRSDLDLLLTGALRPLRGFMGRTVADAVADTGRLPDGTPWPATVALDVTVPCADAAQEAGGIALRDDEGTLLAVMVVEDRWEAEAPLVCLGGPVEGLRTSARWDFADLRASLADIARDLTGGKAVLAAQPTGPVDARTVACWRRAAAALDARLLVLPPVGADPEPVHVHRIRAYRHLLRDLPDGTLLRLLASAREPRRRDNAGLHALLAERAGATHLVLPDDPDGIDPGPEPATVQALGLVPVAPADFAAVDDPAPGVWPPAVADELERADPPRSRRGFVLLLTGLSGSGKSTVAKVLRARLTEAGDRAVTLLDGDLVRRHLSSELGFSRHDRDLNVVRIGYVASEIANHGGIAICAPIAPYDATRRTVRRMVEEVGGGFVLVHVATPIEVCEARDVKGLYARARAGELTGFTGVDDPYEVPDDAEVTIDTTSLSPDRAADAIVGHLASEGWYDPRR